MKNYCTPGKEETNEMVKSGKLLTYTIVKSADSSTNSQFKQEELKYFNTLPFVMTFESDYNYNFLLEEE